MLNSNENRPNAKHVSRACLECRQRHLRCDGKFPKCSRCAQSEKECSYVKSHRGGSRRKGVKKSKLDNTEHTADVLTTTESILSLPCASKELNGSVTVHTCPNGHDKLTCSLLSDKSMTSLPCHSSQYEIKPKLNIGTVVSNDNPESSSGAGHSQIRYTDQNFDVPQVIRGFYTALHNAHPILPPIDEIENFLLLTENPRELLAVMKLIGDGYKTTKYSRNISDVLEIVDDIIQVIESSTKDIVSLQTLILLTLVCHISALHDMSSFVRKRAIELIISLDINNLDVESFLIPDINGNRPPNTKANISSNFSGMTPKSSEGEININFYNTKRARNIEEVILKESARRCFWELFFLDIIIDSSDGTTLSKLTSISCFVNFPSVPSRQFFDYETRAYTSKLVDDSVRLNNSIFANDSIAQQYTKLTASQSNWELKLSNPDFYNLPYLVDGNGIVNEGVHQGLIMLNYAKIFTHRPLSFLWRSDIPKSMKCVELLADQLNQKQFNDNCQTLPTEKELINSRKVIETRKTIDAANLIAKTLIDTNPVEVLKRTPLTACSLAFAGLIHVSACLWSTQVINSTDSNQSRPSINAGDLNIYEEYIKLELSGVYQISTHWYLSSKIATYLIDSLSKLIPELSTRVKLHFQSFIPTSQYSTAVPVSNSTLSKDSSIENTPSSLIESSISTNPLESSHRKESNTEMLKTPKIADDRNSLENDLEKSLEVNTVSSFNFNNFVPGISSFGNQDIPEEPKSPQSDTGCNYIDKSGLDFDFNSFNFTDFDFGNFTTDTANADF